MSFLRRHWVQLLILAVPFLLLAVLWPVIPERVPIHWNAEGEVDGYAEKGFGLLLFPVINLALVLLLGWLIGFDPRLKKASQEAQRSTRQAYELVILFVSGFLSYMSILIVLAAVDGQLDVGFATCLGMLMLFLVMGNVMGKLAPNYLIGIRTPWTLESPLVWRQTHRWGGRVMALGALLGMVLLFLLPGLYFVFGFLIPYAITLAVGGFVYSWWLYRRVQAV